MEMLNESKEYEKAAKTWEGSMLFVVKQGEITPIDLHIYLDLWHGKCRSYEFVYSKEEKPDADFVFEGPEKNWLLMLDGELEAVKGLMTGKFRLTGGNMTPIMRHVKAAQILTEKLQDFNFDYIETKNDVEKDEILQFFDSQEELVLEVNQKEKSLVFHK